MLTAGDDSTEHPSGALAPYAMQERYAAGRRYPEPRIGNRGPWEVDRERLIRSAAYRRLSHKMQVFTGVMGDYHRTRLTHTLEVVVVARSIGRALRLNEDFIEALALLHDLGHPPFGHAGEAVLDRCVADVGGFCHNAHALRIVEELERCAPDYSGLNLTLEVLNGQESRSHKSQAALLEVQVVDAADSIAYDTHDADDAMKLELLSLDELCEMGLWRAARQRVEKHYSDIDADQLRRAILQELSDWQVADAIEVTRNRIAGTGIDSPQRALEAERIVQPSSELLEMKLELERFLYDRVYRHPRVLAMREDAETILAEMFATYMQTPERMPRRFFARIEQVGVARCVGDYLAGMTDRYAEQQFSQWSGRSGQFRLTRQGRKRLTG